jgi:trk system potassium uptake protein TrkH
VALVLELDVLRHAVLAAEVAAVRDRDPEIIHLAVVAVGELRQGILSGLSRSLLFWIVSSFRGEITSSALVVVGVLSVAVMEWTNPHTLGGESMSTKAAMSLFQGVTPRTAGFQTVSYPEMHEPTLVVQTVLMFIGTAPTSTGGGIKVTTLALVVLIVVAQVRGQDRITLFWRTLPRPLISRALSILAMASLLVLLSTLALMVSDGLELLPALFEVTSAIGTVGLSLDVTPHLSSFGKILISVVMFLGRVGPITFIVALAARQRTPQYRYPEEEIAIG